MGFGAFVSVFVFLDLWGARACGGFRILLLCHSFNVL
jgi:hypothetical protein